VSTSDIPVPTWSKSTGMIGGGAAASTLFAAMRDADLPLPLIGTRHPQHLAPFIADDYLVTPDVVAAAVECVFLTVPDDVLLTTARHYAWRSDQWVLHCAGSLSADYLAEAVAPAQAGAFHPLVPMVRPTHALATTPLAGHVVAVDGPEPIAKALWELARLLGAIPLLVPSESRVQYHATAVLASNMLIALFAVAQDIWVSGGLAADLTVPALVPLLRTTLANIERGDIAQALTGPIARGDITTVARHLAMMQSDPALADALATYQLLGQRAVTLSAKQGRATSESLSIIRDLLG